MAREINKLIIEYDFDEFGIRYADGDILWMDDEEDVDTAIAAAKVVVPNVDMTKRRRHVYITEDVESA